MKRLALLLLVAGLIAVAGGTALAQRASGQTVSGTAEMVTPGSLVIQGKTVIIDENTIVEGTLTPGATVVIKTDQVNGALHAARIVIKDGKSDSKRKYVQIDGNISSLSANNTLVIRNKTIATDNETRIEGELAVGSYAKVKAAKLSDGSLLAVKVQVKKITPRVAYIEIEGEITALSANNTMVVRGRTIATDGATGIEGDLEVGADVEVKALKLDDGSLLAVKIEVEEEDDDDEGDDRQRDDDDEDDDDRDDDDDDDEGVKFGSAPNRVPAVPASPAGASSLNGQQLFNANCTGCHGIPSTARTQARLASFISGHNTGRNLTQEQAAAIAAFLKP